MSGFFDGIDDAIADQKARDEEASDSTKFEPKAGEILQGVLLKADVASGKYDPNVVITFRNVGSKTVGGLEPGASGYMFTPTVLRRKIIEAAPKIGTPFALEFHGLVAPEGGGNSYKDFTLVTPFTKDGDATARDLALWDRLSSQVDGTNRGATAPRGGDDADAWQF